MAREGIYGFLIRTGPYGSTKWYKVGKSHLISGTYADALSAVAFVFITVTNFYNFLISFPDPL